MFVGTSTFLPSGILYNVHVFRRVLDSCDDAPCWQWYSILPRTPTPVGDGAFGVSMEFDGRTLMVGDPGDFVSNTGRVLVYELEAEQFVLKQELTVSTAEPSFGQTIALDGKQVAIATMNWPASGAIYLFKRQAGQWVHTERVTTQNGELEQFGFSVDLRGKQLIVGANEGNYAVAFQRRGGEWREQRLTSPGTGSFGLGVEIRGKEAFVSAHGGASVSYFVRERGEWLLTDAFNLPPDTSSFPPSSPGGPVQMLGRRLFAAGFGGVYLFEPVHGEWTLTTHFVTPFRVGVGKEELMDVHRRWLAAIDGSNIYMFDLRSQ